jgi:S-adenosylmethionine hydrolase
VRITLLTDFGTADGYVAAMKGAIAQIAPSALVDDASHALPPGDIVAGAFALRRYWRLYPEGTVHVVVIDPGVGSVRRAIAIAAEGRFLVGPDNGVFTFVLRDATGAEVFELPTDDAESRTFHGRDVFAPVAARLAAGIPIHDVGTVVANPVTIILPAPIATQSSVRGEVVHVDRFGNLASNIPAQLVLAGHVARIGELDVRLVGTYADAEEGELVALINSDGVLEVALRDGNAARALNIGRGAPLELHS